MLESSASQTASPALLLLACALLGSAGCSQGNQEYNEGKKAEAIQDYDTAVVHYERALKADPTQRRIQAQARPHAFRGRPESRGAGQKLRQQGDLQMALAEFQKAMLIDPVEPDRSAGNAKDHSTRSPRNRLRQRRHPPPLPAPSEAPEVMAGPPATEAAVARAHQSEDDQ